MSICCGQQLIWDVGQTSITVNQLVDNCVSPSQKGQKGDVIQVRLHFNVPSQEQFFKLVCSISTIESEGAYKETFYDTAENLLMMNNIWLKLIEKRDRRYYSVKTSGQIDSFVTYEESIVSCEKDAKSTVIKALQDKGVIGDYDDNDIVFDKEYALTVGRYILKPEDERFSITIDTIYFDEQCYTVCAVRAFCQKAEVLRLCEQMEVEISQSDIATVGPVLSKVLFYLYKTQPTLLTSLPFVDLARYQLDNLETFHMDRMYHFGDEVDDEIDYSSYFDDEDPSDTYDFE